MRRVALPAGAAATMLAIWLTLAATAAAASPSPGPGGDPRSPGQGPGLVGDPLFALLVVVGIGVLSVVATLVYVRLTAGRAA